MAVNCVCNLSHNWPAGHHIHADSWQKAVTVLAAASRLPRGRPSRPTYSTRWKLDGGVTVAEVTSGDFCIAVYREDNV